MALRYNIARRTHEKTAMSETTVTLTTPDGPMDSYLALPDEGFKSPFVVVVQEAFGVNTHIKDICSRLAREGYAAIAPELFHRSGRGIVIEYDRYTASLPFMAGLTNDTITQDIQASLDYMRGIPSVLSERAGVIGFCVGGYSAFLAACLFDVDAAVCFYGGGIIRGRPGFGPPPISYVEKMTPPILCFFGAQDISIPPEDIEAIRSRLTGLKITYDIIVYPDAGHGFHCNERKDYRAADAADAWRRTLDWLGRILKS